MAEKKRKPLEDEKVLALVETKVAFGVGACDGRLSHERERVIKYYNSELPKRQNNGRSSYVSTDVYDSVEAMKSQLVETFNGNPDNLISFPPLHDQDAETSRIATEECSYQVWRLNDGFRMTHDVLHNGLTARAGIAKVYWDEAYDYLDEKIEGASFEDVQALAAMEDIDELDAEEDAETGLFNGKLVRKLDVSQVCIDVLPPEEFVIESHAKTIKKAGMTSHRTLKTKAELIAEGYDEKKVEEIKWAEARSLDITPEQLSRDRPIEDGQYDEPIQPELEKVMFYETYVKMNMKDGSGVRLWKICHAGHLLLDKEQVDHAPFIVFVPLPVPHQFYGNNFAARVVPYQNARTMLIRSILDHTSVTNNPRWGVVKGGLMNPKELQDNRLGGIVNMNRPDAVKALEQQQMNPFVFQTSEMLKTNKEESTGISSLSTGMNKDAISSQNAQGLIDNLVSLSMQRQKVIARSFATFLVALYLEVYRLVLENEKQDKVREVAGNFEPIKVSQWIERTTCKVALHLGYGERDKAAGQLGAIYDRFSKDPGLAPMFKPENRYALLMDGMRAANVEGASRYLSKPEEIQPQQPDPLKVRELDIKDKSATAGLISAQANSLKSEKAAVAVQLKESLSEAKLRTETHFRDREDDRMERETDNRIDVSQREMKLLEEHPPTESKGVDAPA